MLMVVAAPLFIIRAATNICCTLCNGAMETLAHMRWSCPYTDHIRQEAQYRDVVLLDNSRWPECINLGLLPTGFRLSRFLPNKDLLPQ